MCLLMARNLFVYNHYLVENMVKKIILLLVVILPLCGCNQKVQCTETSENDSIAEFFRKFYVGCNDYYAQSVNVDDSKEKPTVKLCKTILYHSSKTSAVMILLLTLIG